MNLLFYFKADHTVMVSFPFISKNKFAFIHCSLRATVGNSDCSMASTDRMTSEHWKGWAKKWLWPNIKYYPSISLVWLRKITNNLTKNSWSPCRDLDTRPLELEGRGLPTRPRLSVINILKYKISIFVAISVLCCVVLCYVM
jgi:hypothetical protein